MGRKHDGQTVKMGTNNALQLSSPTPLKSPNFGMSDLNAHWSQEAKTFLSWFQNGMTLSGEKNWTSALCPSWRKRIKRHLGWFAQVKIGTNKSQKN